MVIWDLASYVLIPLVWTRCSGPVRTDHGIRSTAQIVPVLALCFMMLAAGWGSQLVDVIIADARHPAVWIIEAACYGFIVPIVLLASCNRFGAERCRVPLGQHTGYTICMTIMQLFPYIIGSIFFTLHRSVEHEFQNDAFAQGLAQTGVLLLFQVMMVIASLAWDLVARQVMDHAKYLERPVLLFPLVLTQALFLQCFLLSTNFLSTQYFMQLIAMTVSRASLQSGLVPVMKWFLIHRATAVRDSPTRASSSRSVAAVAGILATGGAISLGIISNDRSTPVVPVVARGPAQTKMETVFSGQSASQSRLELVIPQEPASQSRIERVISNQEECVQEGTLNAVLSLHARQLVVTSFAQLASNAAMLTCVIAEAVIFEMQGQPECCEVSLPSANGTWSCFGRGGDHVLRDGLGTQCPRYTARHTRSGRQILILHFLANIASLFAAGWLGSAFFRKLGGWAKRSASGLQTSEEDLLQPPDPDLHSAAAYLIPYAPYLLSTLASVVIVTLTQIRRLQWGQ